MRFVKNRAFLVFINLEKKNAFWRKIPLLAKICLTISPVVPTSRPKMFTTAFWLDFDLHFYLDLKSKIFLIIDEVYIINKQKLTSSINNKFLV